MSDFFRVSLAIPYGLLLGVYLFFEIAGWRSSRVSMSLRGDRTLRLLLAGPLDRWGLMIFWTGACLEDLVGYRQAPALVAAWVSFGAAGLVAGMWLWWVRNNHPEPPQISRGAAFDAIDAIRRKAGVKSVNIYCPPEGFTAPSVDRDAWGSARSIFIPRRLLDWMSRAEIDALVSSQLTSGQQDRYARWIYLSVVAGGAIISAVLHWLKIGSQGLWEAFLLLLIAEITALSFLVPHLSHLVTRRAVQISGDPEAYLSAMAELWRLSTGERDAKLVRRIARTVGVAPERALQLQEQPRPATDRYPTSGDYLTVGF